MLRDRLVSALRKNFPEVPFAFGQSPNPVATLPAVVPEIGALEIYDDGDEATVCFTDITHGHFNPYDESLGNSDAETWITNAVVEFLQDLFSDHVLLWRRPDRRTGGWANFKDTPDPTHFVRGREYFLWSRPHPNPKA